MQQLEPFLLLFKNKHIPIVPNCIAHHAIQLQHFRCMNTKETHDTEDPWRQRKHKNSKTAQQQKVRTKRNHEDMKLTLTPTATVAARLATSESENKKSRYGELVTKRNMYAEAWHLELWWRWWCMRHQSCGRDEDT